jgi:RNA-directed DNA polymerase
MPYIQCSHSFQDIISPENMLGAWNEFIKGKRSKKDVQVFQMRLMDNILDLHQELKDRTYMHGSYFAFNISDPKPRNIHKALVRDRLIHHAIYRRLYPFFDRIFIADSFSCRFNKGSHKAVKRFRTFAAKVGKNNTQTCWILKCDVRKFFASIDQAMLFTILKRYIPDRGIIWLLERVVSSFYGSQKGVGLPLGNLTSQLLVNIYMNELDQFVKHKLKAQYYIRYADDFAILSDDKEYLERCTTSIHKFLGAKLKLTLHPDKVFIKTLASGLDFLGWVHFPDHRVLRTVTKKRMIRNLRKEFKLEAVQSYLGLLNHGNTYKIRRKIYKKAAGVVFELRGD